MKKTLIAIVFSIMLVSSALASFDVYKHTEITGDWKWDGGWNYGNWQTAGYDMEAHSPNALSSFYFENENLGTPWEYELESFMGFDSPGTIANGFSARTINDPVTTPATGGYTRFSYTQNNFGKFTSSFLGVSGTGQVDVETNLVSDSETQQEVFIGVNN